jgi:predicted alpha/beta superfamily hydrolase
MRPLARIAFAWRVSMAAALAGPAYAQTPAAPTQAQAPAPAPASSPFDESTIQSAVLAEPRRIIVRLPRHYARDLTRRFAVVYKLDGTNGLPHYDETIGVLHSLDLMPDVIVVALPNARGMRNRDLTPPTLHQEGGEDGAEGTGEMGRGDRFHEFLRAELIPHIDRTYRTTGERILAGHSRGALLVVHSLLTDPGLFSGRFLFSAPLTRDRARLLDELRAFLQKTPSLPTFLYFNWGGAENEGMQRSSDRMVALLRERSPTGLRWVAERAAGADHQEMATLALPAALTEYFATQKGRGVSLPVRTSTQRHPRPPSP